MIRSRTPVAPVVATLAMALISVACGVPLDAEPRTFEAEEAARIESELAPADVAEAPAAGETVDVWFVEGDRLVATTRTVPAADPIEAIEAVVAGPRPAEEALGLRSAVAPTTRVLDVDVSRGLARVDVSRDFALIGGEEELLAVGQIVATLVGFDAVEAVRFALDGEDIAAPDAEGVLRDRLTVADFRPLIVRDP